MAVTLDAAVASFGASLKAKLSNAAIKGAPEDQLRAPLDKLITDLALVSGLPAGAVDLVGETTLGELRTRPDFAVTLNGALVGFIEVKAPGKGANPARFTDPHDKAQWSKLKSLPNLLYTDGESFGLYRDGAAEGAVIRLDGDLEAAGPKLKAPPTLLALVADFLSWNPIPPKTPKRLAEVSARLCRLLRDEVLEQLGEGSEGLAALAGDWRNLLFPEADNAAFADGYAQAVTFGLLVARARGIALDDGLEAAASKLRASNSLIGTALRLLTDDAVVRKRLGTSLGTLLRVLGRVDWATISKNKPDAWLYFYEDFLDVYDNRLRKRTGSYYTPPEVVSAMVRLVDEALRGPLFERPEGLASPSVTVADPAVGTGTFLLGVLRRIAETVEADQGAGAVRGAIEAAAKRVVGFELQFGPFAVAQLRLIAEMQALMKGAGKTPPKVPDLQLFVTDTLGNPFVEEEKFVHLVEAVGRSRREANRIKREVPITVVIGNPPYKEKAEGRGGWIEKGSEGRERPLDLWQPHATWRVGAYARHLRNLYVYFWRWATLKVFESGWNAATGLPEADRAGIICFITAAGYLNGKGFQRMRSELRRSCSDIWIINCSPDGHRPDTNTRIFPEVPQPVCIVLAARKLGKATDAPARVLFRALPKGRREEKFKTLAALSLEDTVWSEGASGWRDPFSPQVIGSWAEFPALIDLFSYDGSGVMAGRTWVISPDSESLSTRWGSLVNEPDLSRKKFLFYPHLRNGQSGDKHLEKRANIGLSGFDFRPHPVSEDSAGPIQPTRYGLRTLDRQWVLPDARLLNQPNPTLWNSLSSQQIFITAPEDRAAVNGPAISLTGYIPDIHHYNGRGGRVYPLWRDAAATQPNVRPTLLTFLADIYGHEVGPEDTLAYIAAVMAHPAFTARFAADLVRPGLRLPLTADRALFAEAVALGREVVWLHCYGERFAEPKAGRPKGAPRLPQGERPTIPAEGAIPGAPEPLPDTMGYDPAAGRLHVGGGFVDRVTPAMWAYEVSGKNVLRQWFSYRRRDRTKPVIGDRRPPSDLDKIQPDHWPAEYTSDLIDLLNVLGRLVKLEPAQADLLTRICAGPQVLATDLLKAGAIVPKPGSAAA